MATEKEHRDAVIAAINAQNGNAKTLSEIRNATATDASYNEVTVARAYTEGGETIDGSTGITWWRVTCRAVARIENNAHEMRARSRTALESARLTIAGAITGPVKYESSDPIGDDDGWWSGLETWTYDHGL